MYVLLENSVAYNKKSTFKQVYNFHSLLIELPSWNYEAPFETKLPSQSDMYIRHPICISDIRYVYPTSYMYILHPISYQNSDMHISQLRYGLSIYKYRYHLSAIATQNEQASEWLVRRCHAGIFLNCWISCKGGGDTLI